MCTVVTGGVHACTAAGAGREEAHSGPGESSMTTSSSTLKMAAVRAICPATDVACSADWVLSMTDAATATETVGGCCGLLRCTSAALWQQAAVVGESRAEYALHTNV